MPWTQRDRTHIENAIKEIAAGKRTVQVTTTDRSETFQATRISELQDLLTQIDASGGRRSRIFRTNHQRGL